MPARLVRALPEHIEPVSNNVRQQDIDEIYASGGWTIRECLEWAFENSFWVSTILNDDEPVAILGVTPYSYVSEVAVPWLIATKSVTKIPVQFLRISRKYVQTVSDIYPILINYVDDRHSESIRYLKSVGFSVSDPEPYGYLQLPFRKFTLCAVQH